MNYKGRKCLTQKFIQVPNCKNSVPSCTQAKIVLQTCYPEGGGGGGGVLLYTYIHTSLYSSPLGALPLYRNSKDGVATNMHTLYLYTVKTSVTIGTQKTDLHVCRVGVRRTLGNS